MTNYCTFFNLNTFKTIQKPLKENVYLQFVFYSHRVISMFLSLYELFRPKRGLPSY